MGRSAGLCGLALAGLAATPAVAEAQLVSSFEQLPRVVRPGDHVAVTVRDEAAIGGAACDLHGEALQARVTDLAPGMLTVAESIPLWIRQFSRRTGARVIELRPDQVCFIRRRRHDSVLNGAVIGAIFNFSLAMQIRTSPGQESEINNRSHFIFTGFGALVGIGVDLLFQRGRETVYGWRRFRLGKARTSVAAGCRRALRPGDGGTILIRTRSASRHRGAVRHASRGRKRRGVGTTHPNMQCGPRGGRDPSCHRPATSRFRATAPTGRRSSRR